MSGLKPGPIPEATATATATAKARMESRFPSGMTTERTTAKARLSKMDHPPSGLSMLEELHVSIVGTLFWIFRNAYNPIHGIEHQNHLQTKGINQCSR
jgi:hypothetical protein